MKANGVFVRVIFCLSAVVLLAVGVLLTGDLSIVGDDGGSTQEAWRNAPAPHEVGAELRIGLLTRLVWAEAADGTYVEQISVASRALNRVRDPAYPDTLAGVIFDNGGFASVTNGAFYQPLPSSDDPVWLQCRSAARLAYLGLDPTDGET